MRYASWDPTCSVSSWGQVHGAWWTHSTECNTWMELLSTQTPSLQNVPSPEHSKEVPVWRGPGTLWVGVYVQGWVCYGGPGASPCARISVPGPAWLHWWSWLLAGVGASLWIARHCKSWLLFLCKQDRRVESLCAAIPKAAVRTGAAGTRS